MFALMGMLHVVCSVYIHDLYHADQVQTNLLSLNIAKNTWVLMNMEVISAQLGYYPGPSSQYMCRPGNSLAINNTRSNDSTFVRFLQKKSDKR